MWQMWKYFDKYGHKRSIDGSFVRGIKIFTSGPYIEYDLCENCIEDLYEFIGFDEDENKEDWIWKKKLDFGCGWFLLRFLEVFWIT